MSDRRFRILIASDDSPSAERAIALAECVDWPAGTEFRIVTVIPSPTAIAGPETRPDGAPVRRVRLLGADVAPVTVRHGRAATEIIEEAVDWKADLILMGSRGHGELRSLLLGSVAAEVVDHAPCAVLVGRTVCAKDALLAYDGSDTAAAAAEFLALVPGLGAELTVVISVAHVQAPLDSGVAPQMRALARHEHALEVESACAEHRASAEARASAFGEQGRRVSAVVRVGDPAVEILRVAAERKSELVVVGSHGKTGLQRALLGSVARKVVLHAPCSVLVVRKKPRDQ